MDLEKVYWDNIFIFKCILNVMSNPKQLNKCLNGRKL